MRRPRLYCDVRCTTGPAGALQDIPSVPPVRLARHFHEAGDVTLWCRYGEQAADLALAAGDQHTAVVMLRELITTQRLSRLRTWLGSPARSREPR